MKKIFEDIYIGSDILAILNEFFKDFDKVLIFSNDTVGNLYFEKVKNILKHKDKIFYFSIKDGEEYKTIETILPVYDFMIDNEFSRKSVVVSLGGGVVCDMGGYIASTYMRGIEFIQVPTSLLAQVDASVGGKVAINHIKCKNMIGTFKQPYKVIIDIEFLKTLETKEFKSGMGELLKHSFLTKNKDYLSYIEENIENIKKYRNDVLEKIVEESIKVKKYFVDIDPYEKKERAFLNLGHTYAHALESFFDYKVYTHGEAVSKGIIFDLELAFLRNKISKNFLSRAKEILDTDLVYLPIDKFVDLMKKDKKNSFGKIYTILIDEEKNLSKTEIAYEEIKEILNKYKENFLKASIDIGTNSCRLFVAITKNEKEKIVLKKEIVKDLEIVKLGEDVNKNKFLKEEAIDRTLKCLKKYRKIIDDYYIEDSNIICFATSATRDSSNRKYFIKRALEEANIKIQCISGEQEAYINFKGVVSSFSKEEIKNKKILVFDIGGGSTEFTLGSFEGIEKVKSLNIGSVRITEKFFLSNGEYDYSLSNIEKAKNWIFDNLENLNYMKNENFFLIGVAGTTTSQISVREKMKIYDSKKIHLADLTYQEINDNLTLFMDKVIKNEDIIGLDSKRKDVIIGGTIILKSILEYFEKNNLIVSENDNLVGAILGGLNDRNYR